MYIYRDECNLRNWTTKKTFFISNNFFHFSFSLTFCCFFLGVVCLPFKIEMRVYNAHIPNNNNNSNGAASDFKTYVNLDFYYRFLFLAFISFCYCLFNASFWCVMCMRVCVSATFSFYVVQTNKTITHFRFLIHI